MKYPQMDEIERKALEYISRPPTGTSDAWATAFTLAHLRIPRLDILAYDDLEQAYHFEVKIVIDKALSALIATTWPVHDEPQGILL